jgi:hypothetical protein
MTVRFYVISLFRAVRFYVISLFREICGRSKISPAGKISPVGKIPPIVGMTDIKVQIVPVLSIYSTNKLGC